MKQSYRKGVANHPDLEFCGDRREAIVEAQTEASGGRVLSFVKWNFGVLILCTHGEGSMLRGVASRASAIAC
jgi:hypothetical protein